MYYYKNTKIENKFPSHIKKTICRYYVKVLTFSFYLQPAVEALLCLPYLQRCKNHPRCCTDLYSVKYNINLMKAITIIPSQISFNYQ